MRLLLILSLLCVPQAAIAGQRAVYLDPQGKNLVIEVADDGSARVGPDEEEQYGVLRDGHFYMVGKEKGEWTVARIEDLAAAFDQVLPPVFQGLFEAVGKEKSTMKIVDTGKKRKIAGFEGAVYSVTGLDESKPEEKAEMVLSRDPALAPVGKAMEGFLVSTTVALTPLLGKAAAEMAADTQAIFSYGTPLNMADKFKLVSVQTAEVPTERVALPAKPATVDELVADMKGNMAASQEPAEQVSDSLSVQENVPAQ